MLQQQQELARYCTLEEERKKWEAREEMLNNNLARVSREREAVKTTPREPAGSALSAEVTEQLAAVEARLRGKCEELSSLQGHVCELEEERDLLKAETEDQRLELNERRAKLSLLQAKLERRGSEWWATGDRRVWRRACGTYVGQIEIPKQPSLGATQPPQDQGPFWGRARRWPWDCGRWTRGQDT